MKRRSFLKTSLSGLVMTSVPLAFQFTTPYANPLGIGICDWNLGRAADPSYIPLAREVGLEAIQVSIGTTPDNIPLRSKEVRDIYKNMGLRYNIKYCSVAAGSILHRNPITTDPNNARYITDALEAAKYLGAHNILVALFGDGDLLKIDEAGGYTNKQSGKWSEYEWKEKDVEKFIKVVKQQLVNRAEDLGVIIGLENSLSAKQNIQIINEIGSPMVQIYYDIANSWRRGYDVPGEIRQIGNHRMCEVHIKNHNSPLLFGEEGTVDMARCASALKAIGYDKWLVLETSGRRDKFTEDTIANIDFTRKVFMS